MTGLADVDVRPAAVAGQFYPAEVSSLRGQLRELLGESPAADGGESCIAVVVPHAGYVYSGHVAGATYARIAVPARVIVLGVNHRVAAAPLASWARGVWNTPLGPVPVDREMISAISEIEPRLMHDPRAHRIEHSLEVQLPLLLGRRPDLRVAPISLSCHDGPALTALGEAIAAAVQASSDPVLIVASTDFTHYQPASVAKREDAIALDCIRAVDGPRLLEVVTRRQISMCGVGPTTVALVAAARLGAREGELVRYATSGDITGDDSSVVGYAGMILR